MNSIFKPQWLCFDLDGTLVDSAPDLTTSLNYMLAEMQLACATENSVRSWIGNGALKLIKRALAHAQLTQPSEQQLAQAKTLFFSAYAENVAEKTFCYPHCQSTLAFCRAKNIRLACVTNKPRQFTLPLMRKLALDEYFSAYMCGDDLPLKKPDPAPVLAAVQQLKGSPDQGYMVGDSATDMISAREAGVGAIYATYGYNRGDSMDQFNPIRIDSLQELQTLFSNLE